MTILVAGASGATGKHLVNQLLLQGNKVRVIVRSTLSIPESWKSNENVQFITASILELSDHQLQQYTKDCDAIASCLGHNLTFKGIYGQPRNLVTDAVTRLCNAVKSNNPKKPVKFVLMNTSGNSNRDLHEPVSFPQRCVIGLLRLLLPPHVDNERAADYLRTKIGQENSSVEWIAVRPDGLINEDKVSKYGIFPSPIRSAIFNAGKVSRINVGHFMTELIINSDLWDTWKGQMPVIYNHSSIE